jgi:predicted DNA-binding transcriptional regulator AlpA
MANNQDPLIPASQVRERFGGVSDMWIHRRLHDSSGFPRPLYIGRLRFWRLSELVAWEEHLPRMNPQRIPPAMRKEVSDDAGVA